MCLFVKGLQNNTSAKDSYINLIGKALYKMTIAS